MKKKSMPLLLTDCSSTDLYARIDVFDLATDYAKSMSRRAVRKPKSKRRARTLEAMLRTRSARGQDAWRKLASQSEAVSGLVERHRGAVSSEMDRMRACSKIKSVEFRRLGTSSYGDELVVTTNDLYIQSNWGDHTYLIGQIEMRIKTGFPYVYNNIDMRRVAPKGRDFPSNAHPHVDSRGVPCLGNAKNTVQKLYVAKEFEAMVYTLIQFLESVNHGGTYLVVDHWPLKKARKRR